MGRSDAFFEAVVDALVGFLPPELDDFNHKPHWSGVKVWYGDEHREHYECQYVARPDGEPGPALEIGFHSEHSNPARNEAVLAALLEGERRWRRTLGKAAEAGPFVGSQADTWIRVSELWLDDEVLEPDAAIDAAERLAQYIAALEPVRAAHSTGVR
jgi:hypothetical protein